MVGFLDLSSELRQQILLAAMTDDELIDKDIEFNRMFLNVFKNENLYITIEDHLPRENLPPIAKDEDLYWVDDNEIWEIHEDAEFPIFTPVHLIAFATTLTSIHPQIEEDMTWVMEKSLSHLIQTRPPLRDTSTDDQQARTPSNDKTRIAATLAEARLEQGEQFGVDSGYSQVHVYVE
ncbi:hypothetical protein BLS_004587 [Venturia inaequalis]|uniref:Uncharacterized protein n=1 Tax=Venturia inaequalis TaxID=5025 RepID=A0A8H3UIF2_VENIN|nr:hypothetical protein BLS_004587 [Venturia inaequalis]